MGDDGYNRSSITSKTIGSIGGSSSSPTSLTNFFNSKSLFNEQKSPTSTASTGVAVTVNPIVASSKQSSDQYAVTDNAPTIDTLKQDASRADGALAEQVNDIKSEVIKVITEVAKEQNVDMGAFLKSCNTENSSELLLAMAYIGGVVATGGVGGFVAGGFGSMVTAGMTGTDILQTIAKDRNLSSDAVRDVLRTTASRLNADTQAKIQQLTGAKPVADSNAAFTVKPQSALTGGQVAEFLRTPSKAFESQTMRNNKAAINSMEESNDVALTQDEKLTDQKAASAIISNDQGAQERLARGDKTTFEKLKFETPVAQIDIVVLEDQFKFEVKPLLESLGISVAKMESLDKVREVEQILEEKLKRQSVPGLTVTFQTPSRNTSFGMGAV